MSSHRPAATARAEAYCWLFPPDATRVQEMVGRERIGWTTFPEQAWTVLKREEQRRIYADGSVLLDHCGAHIELVCFLQRTG